MEFWLDPGVRHEIAACSLLAGFGVLAQPRGRVGPWVAGCHAPPCLPYAGQPLPSTPWRYPYRRQPSARARLRRRRPIRHCPDRARRDRGQSSGPPCRPRGPRARLDARPGRPRTSPTLLRPAQISRAQAGLAGAGKPRGHEPLPGPGPGTSARAFAPDRAGRRFGSRPRLPRACLAPALPSRAGFARLVNGGAGAPECRRAGWRRG